MEKFNVEYQYQEYLKLIKASEDEMSSIQKSVMRKTFYAGMGQMLLLCRNDISEIEKEEDAIETMQSMLDQVAAFFLREAEKDEGKKPN